MIRTLVIFFFLPLTLCAQDVTLNGTVSNQVMEALPSATIRVLNKITTSDSSGGFSLKIPPGPTTVEITFTGFRKIRQSFKLTRDTTILFVMESKSEYLEEVVIQDGRYKQSEMVQTTRMSSLMLTQKDVTSIPTLGGEADLLKTIQLLPGVSKGVEGSTDLFVRGGAADQNLVLLDGAPVYNTGHLFGFLSVFNPDALGGVESMNGAFPAEYGGRLSSILDVRTKAGMPDRTHVRGNIGLLATRLMVEQPLIADKLSVSVAGRRTYVDQVVRVVGQELPYHFYDFNAKVLFRPTRNDHLEFTHYSGDDVLNFIPGSTSSSRARARNVTSDFSIGNSSQTLRWRRALTPAWSSETLLYRSAFHYSISNTFEDSRLFVGSDIEDLGGKLTVATDSLKNFFFKTGIEIVKHHVSPNIINTSGELALLLESSKTQARSAWEASTFAQLEGQWQSRWRWSAGLRVSSAFVEDKTYVNPEPRLAVRYSLDKNTALKASYSRMAQYMHRVSSAAVAFPTDIWYPVTESVQPQRSHQVSVALQHTIPASNLFASLELYYKKMDHLVGYREGASLFLNNDFESQLVQGNGRAYGAELLLKKESGKLTGWISYTLSWSERQFNEVNSGMWFSSRYDRRHNGAIVANYQFATRWSISAVWEFISGSKFTPVIGQYTVPVPSMVGFNLIPVYAPINSVKLADAHRLDFGVKLRSRPGRRFQSEWFAGVYNVYNRATPVGIVVQPNGDGSFSYAQPGLFGLLPFVSYGFKF